MKSYNLPSGFDADIDKLKGLLDEYNRGAFSAAQLKAYRVPFGIYEQRERDTYMVRVRCAAGCISPKQLQKIADISSRYGANQIHLTTRQELQIHYVKLNNIIEVIQSLKEVGLASRGGGGNTIRNIIASEYSGIDPREAFDVTPYAIALTTRLIAEEDSWTLPRKFKIAFSGSSQDLGYATIADLGFIARIKNSKKGFRVYVAGGMGVKPRVGNFFLDFVSETQVYQITRSVKNLFWKYGNRKNKHAARLRFLWQDLGEDEFRRRFIEEYEVVKKENHSSLKIEQIDNTGLNLDIKPEEVKDKKDFELWKKRFVRLQKQKDSFSVIVAVEMGFIDNAQVLKLAKFLEPFGDNVIHLTKDQNFQLRNISGQYLMNIYNFLKNNLANFNRPFIFDKLISCAGASTCQLGICLSRGAVKAIMQALEKSRMDLALLADLKISISGCPNACGQHHVADLGFFGKAARKNEKLYPAYNVVAGALVSDGKTKFADKIGEIGAKNVPSLVEDFLSMYLSKHHNYKDFREYIENCGKNDLKQICDKYKDVPDFDEDKNYYFDWGAKDVFSLAGRGMGECSAGLFDLIDVDITNIKETKRKLLASPGEDKDKKEKLLRELTFYASRMLLITRGVEPKTEAQVYDSFREHFINTGLVEAHFKDIIQAAESKNSPVILAQEKKIYELADRVKFLYDNMDNAFQFKVEQVLTPTGKAAVEGGVCGQLKSKPKIFKDFRGVACPMNFVKTKIELSKMKSKEILEILLDDGEPIENVPGSVKEEGHKIIEQKKKGNFWSIVIEKK